jgi:hypothetical protein
MNNIVSRPYQTADPKQCCERCVFGTGKHADFCEDPTAQYQRVLQEQIRTESAQLYREYDRYFSK